MTCGQTLLTRIQIRRDIATDWTRDNPTLAEGEMGYELDTGKLKIGNGTTPWNTLSYFDDRTANWTDITGRPINVSDLINDVGYLTVADLPDPYVLPTATDVRLGGIKVGANLTIDGGGVLSAQNSYVLPTASTTVLGGVKVDGSSITIVDGVISALDANLLGDFSINNTTISTTTNNVPITFETHNGATVYTWTFGNSGTTTLPDGLILPVSTLTESVETIEVIVADLVLDATVDYSTGEGDNIPQNTYGIHSQINHPWAVYRFTTTPAPTLEIEDILAGDAIPFGSTVLVIGTGGSSDIVVTDQTILGTVPVNGTVISIARPVTNAALAISTNANTDIALIAGAGGRIVTSSSIIPVTTGIYELGTPTRRFGRLWLGGGSIYIEDEVTGADLRITAINGDLVVAGGAGLVVGQFRFHDQTMYLADPAKEIFIGTTGATAPVTFNRTIRVRDITSTYDLLDVDQQGRMTVLSAIATDPTQAAVSIVGARARDVQSPANLGVLLQLTGSSTAPSRIYHDSYGAANYSAFIGRKARGNSTTPTQTLTGDIIARLGANPHDNVSFASISTMRMDFVNAEDQTTSARGGKIEFWTTPIGSTTIGKRVTIDGSDIVLTALGNGGITFADSTRQTTAWTGSVAAGNVTGLSLVATTNNYSDLTGLPTLFSGVYADLTGKPDVVTSIGVTSGLTVGRVGGAVTIGNSGVLSVAAATGTGQITVGTVGGAVTLTLPQGIATTSDLTFHDLTITGTLTATNFNVETAPTIAGKILYLAADALVAADIDGGGIWLGPVADAYSRSFLYNLEFNRWDTDGAGLKTLQLDSTDIFVTGHGHFGNAYNDYNFPDAAVQTDGNTDSYLQIVTKNHSDGVSASSDYVATNDIGDDTAHYIDMGIVSSNYTDTSWPILAANDGYVYINGGSLRIGTDTASKDIKFFTGGTLVENVRATISDTGLTVVGTTSSTSFSGPLTGDVTGNVSGNAGTVTNGVYTTDTGTVTNLMLAGSIANNKLTNSSVTVNGTTISLGASGTVTSAAGTLTGTILASNVLASSLTSVGTLTNLTVTNPISGSVSGNAGTVTNGVYTTGSYSNPSWITSLAYSKLSGAPSIPAAQIQSDWNQTNNTLLDFIKNKPTIPTVPTVVSAFTNDSGYITSAALTGYATQTYVNSQGFITTGSLSVTSNTPSGTTSTLTYTGGVFTFTSAAASTYTLPTASTTVLGGVKVDGTSITINGSGVISAPYIYTLPTASTTVLGGVKVDGTTITINGSGVITATNTNVGTVTSVAALTIGSAGIDLTSTVANGTTTPVITLNVPTASATNRGVLSSSDWTLFNGKGNGTVTSIATAGSVSGLTLTGGTITTSGTITLGGTLSLTSLQVTTALGYTPGTGNGTVTSVATTGSVNGITLTGGTITSAGTVTLGGTLSGIANNQLTNSTISGVALGGSLFNLTAGTGITFSSGTTYNGSTAITINSTATGGVSSLAGGTNIVLSGSTGAVTIQRVDGCQTVVTANSGATYNVTTTDQYVGTTRSATGTGTITLPLGSTVSVGRQYIVKDEGGQSGNVFRRITVAASGSDTIDGSATRSITSNYGALTVLWTGTRWSVI